MVCRDRRQVNSGFSLIELIVVISIIAIFAGTVTAVLAPAKDARECMKKVEASLCKGRLDSMGKSNYNFKLKKESDGIYLETYDDVTLVYSEKVGKAGVEISYIRGSGDDLSAAVPLASGGCIDEIRFDRSSGALAGDNALRYLVFARNGQKYTLRFYKETGKIETVD